MLDQVLRIVLHGRMQYGLERYEAEHPEVDILLHRAHARRPAMFSYNIMRYSARRVGGASTATARPWRTFRENRGRVRAHAGRHGIGLRLKDPAPGARPCRRSIPFSRRRAARSERPSTGWRRRLLVASEG